jgi:vacuolar-type H+-ATPase subunit E/Vma4
MSVQNILDHIQKEGEAAVKQLNEERDQMIYEIEKEFEKKAEESRKNMDAKIAENEVKIARRTQTFANMEVRNHHLSQKRKMLDKSSKEILAQLTGSSDYEAMLTGLFKTAAANFTEGTIFAARGKEDVTKKALAASGAPFTFEGEGLDIQGGFILKAGQVEADFSFESILKKELWDNLEMELSKILFA